MVDEIVLDRQNSNDDLPSYVVEFRHALEGARDGIVKAAKIYVQAIDEDPERAKDFRRGLPSIPEGTWSQFESIGRGVVDVRLLLGDGGPHRSRIKALPFALQERILEGEKFDLLVDDGEVLKVDMRSVTSDQASQLFAGAHLRTPAEQKAWMVDQERKARLAKGDTVDTMPYARQGNKVTFKKNLTMTLRELKDLVQLMEA